MSLPKPQRAPSLGAVMANAMEARLLDVHTALPAKVEKYDAVKQLVDVKPLIKAYRLSEDAQPMAAALPVICNVPVVFPGSGGFRLTFPVAVGDVVLLVFAESSIDAWQESDGARDVDPADVRRHNLSDAIAIVGLHPNTKPWTGALADCITLGKDDGTADFVALSTKTKDEITALRNTVNSLVSAYNGHGHNVATAGTAAAQTGTTGGPFVAGAGTPTPVLAVPATGTAPAVVASVASATVKVKG